MIFVASFRRERRAAGSGAATIRGHGAVSTAGARGSGAGAGSGFAGGGAAFGGATAGHGGAS